METVPLFLEAIWGLGRGGSQAGVEDFGLHA